jgi:hypothetical protein
MRWESEAGPPPVRGLAERARPSQRREMAEAAVRKISGNTIGLLRIFQKKAALDGWEVQGDEIRVTLPDGRVRIYDYAKVSPVTGKRYGVEVKSSRVGIVPFKACQVACDVTIMQQGGALDSLGERIDGVSYEAALFGPGNYIERKQATTALEVILESNDIPVYREIQTDKK